MSTVEVLTADLIGPALDWATAQAATFVATEVRRLKDGRAVCAIIPNGFPSKQFEVFSPSSSWAQGGPLVDAHKVHVIYDYSLELEPLAKDMLWHCHRYHQGAVYLEYGPTALIGICRVIVASQLGEIVEIPSELVAP